MFPGQTEEQGTFLQDIFLRLVKQYPQHRFYFLYDRENKQELLFSSNSEAVIIKPLANTPFLWSFWLNWKAPAFLKKIKADVFVSADGFCSLRTNVPQCIVVHDLAFLHNPKVLSKSQLKFCKSNTKKFFDKAKVIATVSEFTKQDICKHYLVNEQKVHIVYNGVNEIFQPLVYEQKNRVKEKFTSNCEYFIYRELGNEGKNLINLLKAFSVFKKKQKSNMKLVVCYNQEHGGDDFLRLLKTFKFRNDVVLTGALSKAEIAELLASAYALVYPSLFDGFGVPPQEALHCEVPAIVSRTGALQEIGGNAYLYVNPEDFEDIAAKMILLYKDETLRSKLVENGKQRLHLFSLQQTAAKMWECIELASSSE